MGEGGREGVGGLTDCCDGVLGGGLWGDDAGMAVIDSDGNGIEDYPRGPRMLERQPCLVQSSLYHLRLYFTSYLTQAGSFSKERRHSTATYDADIRLRR